MQSNASLFAKVVLALNGLLFVPGGIYFFDLGILDLGVMQLLAAQALAKARAQDLTQQKQQQMEKMELWMRQFYKVAKVALSDAPQQMEALGIVVPS